jgi:ketosteroid isomerase-like protein
MTNATQLVNDYLTAFWSGDFDTARRWLADDFSFRGPLAQADDSVAFLASAAPLAPIVRGHELVRQWIHGDEVCSIYRCRLETARGAGSVLIAEWDTVRDDRLVAAQLVFDAAAFRALLPPPAQESTPSSVTQTRDTVRAYHAARTRPDVARAGDFIADEFKTRAPVGSYDTRAE